ncbi:hypothetical protein SDC9_146062 [bioreactor metagenome]|uniref:Uncharacterized protein n=1 Tax=bioreactor metagenome TaxID=1076179 RepID=A0A645EE47_9ZZZZ
MDGAHLRDQLAHVLRASAGSSLIGHRRRPFDQVVLEQPAKAHQHQRHRAVATDPVLATLGQRVLDHVHIDRIEHDHRIVGHAQRRGSIDPVTVPAGSAQLGEDFLGVVAALAGDDDFAGLQRIDVRSVLQRQRGFLAAEHRCLAASGGGREINRIDEGEIALLDHALHQHGTNHATPTDQTKLLHFINLRIKPLYNAPARVWYYASAARTASPISRVPTLVVPRS